jgi:hypothetical protein
METMKGRMLVLWLVPLLGACAAPVPQADPAAQGQQAPQTAQAQQAPLVQRVVVHDYALDSITGSHLKRRRDDSPMNGQTLSREDWQRGRPDPCVQGCM